MIEHACTVRVRYAETDRMGVAYYSRYFEWFEAARSEMLRAFGKPYAEVEQSGVLLPAVEARCRYRRPAHYDEQVTIRSRITEIGKARLRIEYDVYGPGGEHLAEGHTVHASIDPKGKPIRLPAFLEKLSIDERNDS